MKTVKIMIALFLTIIAVNCKSQRLEHQYFFHNDINKENYRQMLEAGKLQPGESLWINNRIVCVKDRGNYFRVGSVVNGKKRGKWYHYYYHQKADTLDCYVIMKYTRKDSSYIYAVSVNRNDW